MKLNYPCMQNYLAVCSAIREYYKEVRCVSSIQSSVKRHTELGDMIGKYEKVEGSLHTSTKRASVLSIKDVSTYTVVS